MKHNYGAAGCEYRTVVALWSTASGRFFDIESFDKRLNGLLADGWTLLGPPIGVGSNLVQTLIKYAVNGDEEQKLKAEIEVALAQQSASNPRAIKDPYPE